MGGTRERKVENKMVTAHSPPPFRSLQLYRNDGKYYCRRAHLNLPVAFILRIALIFFLGNIEGASASRNYRIAFLSTSSSRSIPLSTRMINSCTINSPYRKRTSFVTSKSELRYKNDSKNEKGDEFQSEIKLNPDDTELLNQVTMGHLQELCMQCDIPIEGTTTKEVLLLRLRNYAFKKAREETERQKRLKEKIERGAEDDANGGLKAKHRIVNVNSNNDGANGKDLEEDEGYFYFQIPGDKTNKMTGKNESTNDGGDKVTISSVKLNDSNDVDNNASSPNISSSGTITAPPIPPGIKPNENGERVVTVYSTKDQNDLTGMASSQSFMSGGDADTAMMGGYGNSKTAGSNYLNSDSDPRDTLAAGPFGDSTGSRKKSETKQWVEEAKTVLDDLVCGLLAMTGAPAFRDEFDGEGFRPIQKDNNLDLGMYRSGINKEDFNATNTQHAPNTFTGFDPSRVPTSMLTASSSALRAGNGEALSEVLREYELRAVGHDGMHGDDKSRGGGHYAEVQKVSAFLQGFRKAETRRIARETSTMLLDKLVSDGVKGLDDMLSFMARGTGGDSGYGGGEGELNDSLLEYLDDAVKQQEKKVGCTVDTLREQQKQHEVQNNNMGENKDSGLWNSITDRDGKVIESIDPNDPSVKIALNEEIKSVTQTAFVNTGLLNPSEQMLVLLTLLRDRIKAECAFTNDEKGRNLRVLAYCLHASCDEEREKTIIDNIGSSLDSLNSFSTFVSSSIDYAESTSHQLQPSRAGPLNLFLLKSIKVLVQDITEKQNWKASGVSKSDQSQPLM